MPRHRSLWFLVAVVACAGGGTGDDKLRETGGPRTDASDGDSAPLTDSGRGVDSGAPRVGSVAADLVPGTVVACPAPADRATHGPFQHVDHAMDAAGEQEPADRPVTTGLTSEDFDGDGHLDVLLARHDGMDLFLGDGAGGLRHENERLPSPRTDWSNHSATVAADFDADGDVDVIVANRSAPDELWWNDGTGVFTRDDSAPFATEVRATVGASLADVDGDGDLDLFLAGHSEGSPRDPADASAVYAWTDGRFEAVPGALPADTQAGFTFNGTWLDADDDGDLDLYLVNDHGTLAISNRLLLNVSSGGEIAFRAAPDAGLDVTMLAMGVAMADVNHDAWPDLVVTNFGQLCLFESAADGTWYEASAARGLVQAPDTQVVGWSTVAEDFDNDADLDVWITFGSLPAESTALENPAAQPDGLWLHGPDGYTDQAPAWGVDDDAIGRSGLAVDLNEDGYLDLVTGPLVTLPRVHLSRCGDAAWLGVDLEQPGANPGAIGAEVVVRVGEVEHRRWVVAGGTQIFGSPPSEVHVGLADATVVDEVVVTWPDGETSVVGPVEVSQRVRVVRRE